MFCMNSFLYLNMSLFVYLSTIRQLHAHKSRDVYMCTCIRELQFSYSFPTENYSLPNKDQLKRVKINIYKIQYFRVYPYISLSYIDTNLPWIKARHFRPCNRSDRFHSQENTVIRFTQRVAVVLLWHIVLRRHWGHTLVRLQQLQLYRLLFCGPKWKKMDVIDIQICSRQCCL